MVNTVGYLNLPRRFGGEHSSSCHGLLENTAGHAMSTVPYFARQIGRPRLNAAAQ